MRQLHVLVRAAPPELFAALARLQSLRVAGGCCWALRRLIAVIAPAARLHHRCDGRRTTSSGAGTEPHIDVCEPYQYNSANLVDKATHGRVVLNG